MPHARGVDPGLRDPPGTRERDAPNDEDGRILQSIAEIADDRSSGCEDGALWHGAQSDESPDCDEQFAGHRDDRYPPRAPLKLST